MSKEKKCETQGCIGVAEFIDDMENKLCWSCVEREIQDGEKDAEDFEQIENSLKKEKL